MIYWNQTKKPTMQSQQLENWSGNYNRSALTPDVEIGCSFIRELFKLWIQRLTLEQNSLPYKSNEILNWLVKCSRKGLENLWKIPGTTSVCLKEKRNVFLWALRFASQKFEALFLKVPLHSIPAMFLLWKEYKKLNCSKLKYWVILPGKRLLHFFTHSNFN